MKHTKEDIKNAWDYLQQFKGKEVAACIKSVSRSGMCRRIEFYADGYHRIGYYIAIVCDYPYNADKGGMQVSGCGMDMVFSVLSNLNYAAAAWDKYPNEEKARIYDNYFIDANRYVRL